jgi:hypothetical protein
MTPNAYCCSEYRIFYCYAECHYTEGPYAEYCYTETPYAVRPYAELVYAKCRFTDSNHAECSDAECQCAISTNISLVHVTLVIIFIGLNLQSTN